MPVYSSVPFTLVNNTSIKIRKLMIDDSCPIDEFISEMEENPLDISALKSILTIIERYKPGTLLPNTVFNHIDGDVYEFKKKRKGTNAVRIYVQLKRPNMLVLIGGSKNSQKKDIAIVKKLRPQLNLI